MFAVAYAYPPVNFLLLSLTTFFLMRFPSCSSCSFSIASSSLPGIPFFYSFSISISIFLRGWIFQSIVVVRRPWRSSFFYSSTTIFLPFDRYLFRSGSSSIFSANNGFDHLSCGFVDCITLCTVLPVNDQNFVALVTISSDNTSVAPAPLSPTPRSVFLRFLCIRFQEFP